MKQRKGPKWLAVSSRDALLKPVGAAPPEAKSAQVVERVLESAVALDPSLIGAEDCLPLLLHGGQDSPDQLYIDELGRLTVVEVKKVTASRDALIQLLSYGHHWAGVHGGTLGNLFAATAERASLAAGADVLSVTRPELKAWRAHDVDKLSSLRERVDDIERTAGESGLVERMGKAVVSRLYPNDPGWTDRRANLAQTASARWGQHALELRGAPPKLVLVAPDFDPACVELAQALQARWLDLALVRLQLHSTRRGEAFLAHELVSGLPHVGAAWRALARVWPAPQVRGFYVPGRFYMYREATAVLSVVHRDQPDLEVSLTVDQDLQVGGVFLRVPPHGWFDGDPMRLRNLQRRFEAVLNDFPEHDRDGRDPRHAPGARIRQARDRA